MPQNRREDEIRRALAMANRLRQSPDLLDEAVLLLDDAHRTCLDRRVRAKIRLAHSLIRIVWGQLEGTRPSTEPPPSLQAEDVFSRHGGCA